MNGIQQISEQVQSQEELQAKALIQIVLEFIVFEFVEVVQETRLIDQRIASETKAITEVGRESGTTHGQIDHEGIAQIVVGIARPVLNQRCRP